MRKKYFFSFWLLLTMGMTTLVFNSCGKDDDPSNPNTIVVSGISLDTLTLMLAIGEDYTLIATVTPDEATDKIVTWTSSDNNKVTVDANGKVTANVEGTTTITAKVGNQTVICEVRVRDGVKINGIIWAKSNIAAVGTFAVNLEDPGMLYQWNRKTAWAATGTVIGWDATMPEGIDWEKANDPSPAGWRVPTREQLESLLVTEKVTNVRITQNGINGRRFTDEATGKSIFLPAVGFCYGDDGTLCGAGSYGGYWSSTQDGSSGAYYLNVSSGDAYVSGNGRTNGFSVRPVAE
jgi:uncharacterized protein (TIGR02145 family)